MKYETHFDIICKKCGKVLKAELNWRGNVLVEPCETCMNKADVVKDWLVEPTLEVDITKKTS
jgi:hypothetical protein